MASKALYKFLLFLCLIIAETAYEAIYTIALNRIPIVPLLCLLGSSNLGNKRGNFSRNIL